MKVSIITTIYKAEKDLPRLLDSMMAQKSDELEFFLIDNGSPDRCREICREYEKKDPRFVVLTIDNNIGYIRARNLGIRRCTGDYIGFCDSDDYLEVGGYDRAISKIKKANCDLYIAAYQSVTENSNVVNVPPYPVGEYQDLEICEKLLPQAFGRLSEKPALQGFAWKQIFKKGIFVENHLKYIPELQPYEDQILNIDYLRYCKKVMVDNNVIYKYIVNNKSITAKLVENFNLGDEWKRIELFRTEKLRRAFEPHHIEACNNQVLDFLYSMFLNIAKQNKHSISYICKSIENTIDSEVIKSIVNGTSNKQSTEAAFIRWTVRHEQYALLLFTMRLALKLRRL